VPLLERVPERALPVLPRSPDAVLVAVATSAVKPAHCAPVQARLPPAAQAARSARPAASVRAAGQPQQAGLETSLQSLPKSA